MAKAKDLIALAGLAGLAYANRDKLFGSKDKDKGDARPARPESTETRDEEPRRKITDYMKKAPEDEKGSAQSDVLKTVTAPKTASNAQAGNQGVLGGSTSSSKPKPRGMTGAQNDALANAGKKSKATAENNALAKVNRGMDREVTEAAKANAAPASSTSKVGDAATDAVKTVAKAAVQGPAASIATTAKPLADKATNAMRETYRDLSGKVQYKTPDIPSAAKTVSDAVASGAKKVGSGIADYAKNFETPAEARSRRDKEALGKKRGGMVNMASGGMTASRRGDGIASRGKTRGKIC